MGIVVLVLCSGVVTLEAEVAVVVRRLCGGRMSVCVLQGER